MARKYGVINQLSTKFEDYNYFINGVSGVGKTTLAYEIGKQITGSNEGTLIVSCGQEPLPKHIPNAFYAPAPTFKNFIEIAKDLIKNKADYPNTKFIGIDSADEFVRITEDYVVDEWNDTCDIAERAKSISQAYKGFQRGENRVRDLMIQWLGKLTNAGYKLIIIGHTKIKQQEDIFSGISYEQITCNLENKYFNAIKDKVSLVATCYFEKTIENIKEKKNAFNKEMEKVGDLVSEKRVIVFRDDNMAVDTKSHFKYIVPKVEFSTNNFINAVQNALDKQAEEDSAPQCSASKIIDTVVDTSDDNDEEDAVKKDADTIDKTELISDIRAKFKSATAEIKADVKAVLKENGAARLSESLDINTLNKIKDILE